MLIIVHPSSLLRQDPGGLTPGTVQFELTTRGPRLTGHHFRVPARFSSSHMKVLTLAPIRAIPLAKNSASQGKPCNSNFAFLSTDGAVENTPTWNTTDRWVEPCLGRWTSAALTFPFSSAIFPSSVKTLEGSRRQDSGGRKPLNSPVQSGGKSNRPQPPQRRLNFPPSSPRTGGPNFILAGPQPMRRPPQGDPSEFLGWRHLCHRAAPTGPRVKLFS